VSFFAYSGVSAAPKSPPPTVPQTGAPTDKDQCKNGGWATFTNPTFKNQGDCVSYTNHANKSATPSATPAPTI
jgi:hypothetical protein